MIKKVKVKGETKFRVVTHQTGRNMGTYNTRAQAQARLNHIKKFRRS
jgi:hypothetical protein